MGATSSSSSRSSRNTTGKILKPLPRWISHTSSVSALQKRFAALLLPALLNIFVVLQQFYSADQLVLLIQVNCMHIQTHTSYICAKSLETLPVILKRSTSYDLWKHDLLQQSSLCMMCLAGISYKWFQTFSKKGKCMPIKPPFQLARCQIIHPPSPSLFNLSQIMQAEHGEAKDRKQAFWRIQTHRDRNTDRGPTQAGGPQTIGSWILWAAFVKTVEEGA